MAQRVVSTFSSTANLLATGAYLAPNQVTRYVARQLRLTVGARVALRLYLLIKLIAGLIMLVSFLELECPRDPLWRG